MKKCLCLLLGLMLYASAAFALGQSYVQFENAYAENVLLINASVGLHLLPHTPSRDYDEGGNRIYRYQGQALAAEMHMDKLNNQIMQCKMTLTAPKDMPYGSTAHRNFEVEGYQFYALVMAMDEAPTAAERYALVGRINEALAASGGEATELAVGDYRLTCTSADGVATLLFENALLLDEPKDETPAVDEGDEDDKGEEEGSYIG